MKPIDRSKTPPVPSSAAAKPAAKAAKPASAAKPSSPFEEVKNLFDQAKNEIVHLHPPDIDLPHLSLDGLKKALGLYPSAAERPACEKAIDAKVAKMNLSPSAKQALALLSAQHVSSVDLWHGSHMIVQGDGGALYAQLAALPGVEARGSSHYPGVKTQQYGLPLGTGELLFGKTGDGSTWFQMEGHPFHGGTVSTPLGFAKAWVENPEHMLDWATYEITGQNVGPLGLSPHTEHHDPVRISYTPAD